MSSLLVNLILVRIENELHFKMLEDCYGSLVRELTLGLSDGLGKGLEGRTCRLRVKAFDVR